VFLLLLDFLAGHFWGARVMRSKDAWERAAECAATLSTTTDPAEREFLLKMRGEWIEVATHLAEIEDRALDKSMLN
jgi:hypothetical protein